MERVRKCRICKKEIIFPEKHYCNYCIQNCQEKINAYEKKLENKRKYKQGAKIKTLEEFDKAEFVYWNGKIYHCGFIHSMPYFLIHRMIKQHELSFAIKKGECIEEKQGNDFQMVCGVKYVGQLLF